MGFKRCGEGRHHLLDRLDEGRYTPATTPYVYVDSHIARTYAVSYSSISTRPAAFNQDYSTGPLFCAFVYTHHEFKYENGRPLWAYHTHGMSLPRTTYGYNVHNGRIYPSTHSLRRRGRGAINNGCDPTIECNARLTHPSCQCPRPEQATSVYPSYNGGQNDSAQGVSRACVASPRPHVHVGVCGTAGTPASILDDDLDSNDEQHLCAVASSTMPAMGCSGTPNSSIQGT
jgi:hypothetical protein